MGLNVKSQKQADSDRLRKFKNSTLTFMALGD